MLDQTSLEPIPSRCINMVLLNTEIIIRMAIITRTSSNTVSIQMDQQTTKYPLAPKFVRQKAPTRRNELLRSVVRILPGADASGINRVSLQHNLNIASCQNWSMLHTYCCRFSSGSSSCLDSPHEDRISRHWIVTYSHPSQAHLVRVMFCLVVGMS